jgi:hypothetical protein
MKTRALECIDLPIHVEKCERGVFDDYRNAATEWYVLVLSNGTE